MLKKLPSFTGFIERLKLNEADQAKLNEKLLRAQLGKDGFLSRMFNDLNTQYLSGSELKSMSTHFQKLKETIIQTGDFDFENLIFDEKSVKVMRQFGKDLVDLCAAQIFNQLGEINSGIVNTKFFPAIYTANHNKDFKSGLLVSVVAMVMENIILHLGSNPEHEQRLINVLNIKNGIPIEMQDDHREMALMALRGMNSAIQKVFNGSMASRIEQIMQDIVKKQADQIALEVSMDADTIFIDDYSSDRSASPSFNTNSSPSTPGSTQSESSDFGFPEDQIDPQSPRYR